jgi:hypothetical protein
MKEISATQYLKNHVSKKSTMESSEPLGSPLLYRITQPQNYIETVDIETTQRENTRLKARLQELQLDRLQRENEELERQIHQFGSTSTLERPSDAEPTNIAPLQAPVSISLANPPDLDGRFSFNDYDLPPLSIYVTREKALSALNQWGLRKGYGFSNAPSKPRGKGRMKAILACDRRQPKAAEAPMKEPQEGRNKGSQGTGCKFSLICLQTEDTTGWELKYRAPWKDPVTKEITNFCLHNHEPSSGIGSEHTSQRREQRKGERNQALLKQFNAGNKPRQIMSYLEKNYPNDLQSQEIFIIKLRQFVKKEKGGRAPLRHSL